MGEAAKVRVFPTRKKLSFFLNRVENGSRRWFL
jgi:hypothetical protein